MELTERLTRIQPDALPEAPVVKLPKLSRREQVETNLRNQLRTVFSEENLGQVGFSRVEEIVAEELYSTNIVHHAGRRGLRRITTTAHQAATELGARGGRARAAALSPRQRRAIARKAVAARIAKYHQRRPSAR